MQGGGGDSEGSECNLKNACCHNVKIAIVKFVTGGAHAEDVDG
jgi:hypothetical protein